MKSWKTIFKPKHSNKVTYLAEMNHIWNSILVLLATTLSNFLCLLHNQPIKYVIISVIEYRYLPCMFLYNFADFWLTSNYQFDNLYCSCMITLMKDSIDFVIRLFQFHLVVSKSFSEIWASEQVLSFALEIHCSSVKFIRFLIKICCTYLISMAERMIIIRIIIIVVKDLNDTVYPMCWYVTGLNPSQTLGDLASTRTTSLSVNHPPIHSLLITRSPSQQVTLTSLKNFTIIQKYLRFAMNYFYRN